MDGWVDRRGRPGIYRPVYKTAVAMGNREESDPPHISRAEGREREEVENWTCIHGTELLAVASVANGPPNEPHLRTTRSVFFLNLFLRFEKEKKKREFKFRGFI